ncbi:MAG TPA: site-2 protease family protein, partial [Cyclobacteriaceae bacterium]|nr:site-2 protease family protein [Cyclobacteriaceae bacterium]
ELGHAAAANYFGIGTREISLLPIGGIALLERLPQRPLAEFFIAVAGPLVNFLIATILFLPARDALNSGMIKAIESINGHNFIVNVFMVNLTMGVFNLIPAFPMDGGRVLRSVLSIKLDRLQATRIAARTGQILAVIAVMISVFTNQQVVSNPGLLLISLFIFYSAQAELQSFIYWSTLDGHIAREVTMKEFGEVDSSDKLSKAVQSLLSGSHHSFVVFSQETAVGTLSRSDIIQGLAQSGTDALVGDSMHKGVPTIPDDMPLEKAYNVVMESNERPVVVTSSGEMIGVIDADNLLEFIMTRQAISRRR